jgi:hypothetical protein
VVYSRLIEQNSENKLDAVVSAVDDRTRLVAALSDLPQGLRAVVVLSDVYDMPHEAIATELEISRAAVKVRLHRGRRRLREALCTDPVSRLGSEVGTSEGAGHDVDLLGAGGDVRRLTRGANASRTRGDDAKRGRRAVAM